MRRAVADVLAGILILAPTWTGAQGGLTDNVTTDPTEASFVYDDIVRFVRAFDMLTADCDSAAVLQAEYLEKGTPGLGMFIEKYGLTAERLAKAIREHPENYAALPDMPALLDEQIPAYRREYVKLKEYVPNAVFPPTYFLVGAFRGIGSGSIEGPLLSVEKWRRPIEEGKRATLVHEMVHLQQVAAQGYDRYIALFGAEKSLLGLCIREGTGEYFAHRVTGIVGKDEALAFARANERRLWEQLQREMLAPETGDWMWRKPADPEQPRDVGYAMGYLIVEAYHENAEDPMAAVREILAVTDYPPFLARSGYADQFAE